MAKKDQNERKKDAHPAPLSGKKAAQNRKDKKKEKAAKSGTGISLNNE